MIVDYVTLLSHIRVPIISVRIVRMFRVFRGIPSGGPLSAGPVPSRFSDPAGIFAVLYGAESVSCCLWEAVVRNRLTLRWPREITRSIVTSRYVVAFDSKQVLQLVDLRDDGPVRFGAPPAVVHDSNHRDGRQLSAAVHSQISHADGFLYHSRYTGRRCCAIFDRAFGKLNSLPPTRLIHHASFRQALKRYRISLI